MVKTIGNPLSWAVGAVVGAGEGAGEAAAALGTHNARTPPRTRPITTADIRAALTKGGEDFAALRSDVIFLVALYPLIGLVLAATAFDLSRLPLLFPMMAGFTLLGPVAAIGLYEMSRRREAGDHVGWGAALGVLKIRVLAPVLVLGVYLLSLFLAWMFTARWVYDVTMGPEDPTSVGSFLSDLLTTGAGWGMIVLGCGLGALFAVAVLVVSLISFPMLVDRRAGLPAAVLTSVRVARESPRAVAQWGLIVAGSLAVGMIPAFLGLIVVLPILGHATWHLYRAAVPNGPRAPQG